MYKHQYSWLTPSARKTITPLKHRLSSISIKVRTDQYKIFLMQLQPNYKSKILDVGVSSNEILEDTNMFEKLYPFPNQLTAATIEDRSKLRKIYPKINVVKIIPNKKLPFKNRQFDIVTSWATLEHVGSILQQKYFIEELLRVGKKIFITTPYRGCIYEPHSGVFFLHWLPLVVFRKYCQLVGNTFWAAENNLNPLWINDLRNMFPQGSIKIRVYKMFRFLPSHLIIIST